MDKLTVKIMSFSCKMADVMEEGVSCKYVFYLIKKPSVFYCFVPYEIFDVSILHLFSFSAFEFMRQYMKYG
jgi:hypothetical protein